MGLKTFSHNLLFELNRVIDPGFALGFNFHSVYVSTIHNGHKCTKPLSYPQDDLTGRLRGSLSITAIINKVIACNSKSQVFHYLRHNYFVFDEIDKLTLGAQQSLKSVMDLERCMFFFNTNYLHKVDAGIINRCYLVEMNQSKDPKAYLKIANNVMTNMGLAITALAESTVLAYASKAKGSLREFVSSVVIDGLRAGGVVPV